MRKPNLFIVGAPRSGTTAMYEYLKPHPEIFMAAVKEAHFFGSDIKKIPSHIRTGMVLDLDGYLALFRGASGEKWLGEGTPMYLQSKRAAFEIKDFSPDARIIIMLRNPVDMMYSLYHLVYGALEDIADFEAALEAEPERKQGLRIPRTAFIVNSLFYREAAKHWEHVKRYFEVFGRDNVHCIIYDDFMQDVANEYRKTLQFLDVSTEFQPSFDMINPSTTPRSRFVQKLWEHRSEPAEKIAQVLLPPWMRPALRRLYYKVEAPPPMDPELRRRLQAEFVPGIAQLRELLDRDLTHWCNN